MITPAKFAMTGMGFILLFFLTACAPKQKGPEVARPWIPPTPFQSLAALADVDVTARGKTERFQAALLAESPNRLRIQILDDLGQEQALLIANGQQVMWWNRRDGIQKILPQDPKVLKKTLKLPLGLEEFIARLLEGTAAGKNSSVHPQYQIVTAEWEDTPQGPYPRQWTWNFQKPKATLSLFFSQVKLNPKLQAGKFDF